jgi:hypothetical protein
VLVDDSLIKLPCVIIAAERLGFELKGRKWARLRRLKTEHYHDRLFIVFI